VVNPHSDNNNSYSGNPFISRPSSSGSQFGSNVVISSSGSSSSNNSSQNNNQTGQNNNNQGGQHKLKTALDKLAAEGKGDTEQANVLKRYLSGVISPQDTSPEGTSYYGKQTLYDDFLTEQINKPIDFSGKFGKYDVNQPMAFGFGSVFGASSGIPGMSSQTVTDSLQVMFDDFVGKGIPPQTAADLTFDAMYPSGGIFNLMGDPATQQAEITKNLMGSYSGPSRYGIYGSGFGGGGGGFNYGYGSGGGGGGGGFGYNMNMGMIGQPKQRGQVGPGSLQEQVNQAFLSGGKPFAKGGIVSLVED
jgi:hypothetical protein